MSSRKPARPDEPDAPDVQDEPDAPDAPDVPDVPDAPDVPEPAETLSLRSTASGFVKGGLPGAKEKAPGAAFTAPAPKVPPPSDDVGAADGALTPKAPSAPPTAPPPAAAPPPMAPPPAAPPPAAPPPSGGTPPGTGANPGALPRPPAPSETLVAPRAPPSAPGGGGAAKAGSGDTADEALSGAARELVSGIAGVAAVSSSLEFSMRLPEYLARYWEQRRGLVDRDDEGRPVQDYVGVLRSAAGALDGDVESGDAGPDPATDTDADAGKDADASAVEAGRGASTDRRAMETAQEVLEHFREVADELDGDKLSFFAPGLRGRELRLLQAVHDLCLALIYYKLTLRMEAASDRLVMLTSSSGAQGCLEQSRNRFAGARLPTAIHNYARLLELKLRVEEEGCRRLLEQQSG